MKTLVKIFRITAVAVIIGFGFTACDNGTTGGDGTWFSETVFETIPDELRGTTWTNDGATGGNWKTWAFSADGKTITGTVVNEAFTSLTVLGVIVTNEDESYTTYTVRRVGAGTSGDTSGWGTEWLQGGYGTSTFHVRTDYLTVGTNATQFAKQP